MKYPSRGRYRIVSILVQFSSINNSVELRTRKSRIAEGPVIIFPKNQAIRTCSFLEWRNLQAPLNQIQIAHILKKCL